MLQLFAEYFFHKVQRGLQNTIHPMTPHIRYLLLLFICLPIFSQAQSISSTVRVGLNFSNVNGPLEKNADGTNLEAFEGATGFHIGGGVNVKFDDYFGVRGEVLFYQNNFKYKYEGQSFQRLQTESGNPVFANGDRRTLINVNNNYINIPITGFVKLWDRVEFYGGGYVSFLVGSKGEGETIFSGESDGNNPRPIEYTVNLDHTYIKDGSIGPEDLQDLNDPYVFLANFERVIVPRTLSSYYDYEEKTGNFYNGFDAGLLGGVKGFINQGLFVGLGLSFGLVDITNNDYDFEKAELGPGNQVIPKDDNDTNFAVQLSIGFGF